MPAQMSVSAKGNPASHRMGNPKLKARRAACWERGQKRKAERNARQAEAAKRNRERDDLTPWQVAKALRAERRAATRAA